MDASVRFCPQCGADQMPAPPGARQGPAQGSPYDSPRPGPQQFSTAYPPKSRLAYILLGLFLGGLGVHNFYAGYTTKAVIQLLVSVFLFWLIFPPLIIFVWVIVEICTVTHDAQGKMMS